MSKILKYLAVITFIFIFVIPGIACAKKTATPAAATQLATVKVGSLTVSTSVDGNLVMPQAYNLLFGAPGTVQDVFVQEGDVVKEGTILATLDNTSQKLTVESSNNNVQTVLSRLYENVPLLPQFPTVVYDKSLLGSVTDAVGPFPDTTSVITYNSLAAIPNPGGGPSVQTTTTTTTKDSGTPGTSLVTDTITTTKTTVDPAVQETDTGYYFQTTHVQKLSVTTNIYALKQSDANLGTSYAYYYPNVAALSAYKWAQDEVNAANSLYQRGDNTTASSELYIASSDLEACAQVIEDAINNPKSGLGNIAPLVPSDEAGQLLLNKEMGLSWEVSYIVELRKVVDLIKQGQTDVETVRGLMAQGKSETTTQAFQALLDRVGEIGKAVIININVIKAHGYSTVYGKDISTYFYNASAEKLTAALKGVETDGLNAPELYDNLLIAEHYMRICNSILGSNDYVLQHGLSLKNEQQAHVDLQNALVGLGNSQNDFLKTVILAPFNGTVVSVGVKKNDVLSQIDYGSVTAVQLVDTSQIKFQGKVDEIDILKIKTGQKAMISVDAVPNKLFSGTVSFISPFGTPDTNGVVQFPITIQLDPSDVALKGGLTATADISISSVENALLVPLAAITTSSEGSFVTIVDKTTGKQEKRQVTLGNQNLQFAEVTSGLKEGDEIVIQETAIKAPIVTGFPRGPSGGPPAR